MAGASSDGCPNVVQTTCLVGPKEVSYHLTLPISSQLKHDILGSSGDNIVAHFAVNYHNEAAQLGVDLNELYSALVTDGEVNPPEWNIEGREINVYK